MARRLRLQFPGARYHIINRGNYQHAVFASPDATAAFERTLDQTCARFGWKVHAYVVMSNHYHLALETPRPNLVEGMHWLQGTYASRHNRFRRRHGHLFQGRYKSLLIENDDYLLRVVDYIHLNPVRAHLTSPDGLAEFRASSLWHFLRRSAPPWLVSHDFLSMAHLIDVVDTWPNYIARLQDVARVAGEDDRMHRGALSAGWAIGTSGWRQALARDHADAALAPELSAEELHAFKHPLWQRELDDGLSAIGRTLADAAADPKGEAWKISLAVRLRQTVNAPYQWIATSLNMGAPSSVRAYVSEAK